MVTVTKFRSITKTARKSNIGLNTGVYIKHGHSSI